VNDKRFALIFFGNVIPGFARNEVIELVAAYLGRSPQIIQKLFQGKPIVVKKNLDSKTAARELRVFKSFGVSCRIKPIETNPDRPTPSDRSLRAEGSAHCPKCRSPLREMDEQLDECPYCGIILSKYRKALQQPPAKRTSTNSGRQGKSKKDRPAEAAKGFVFEPVMKSRRSTLRSHPISALIVVAGILGLIYTFAILHAPGPPLARQESEDAGKPYKIRQKLRQSIHNPRILDEKGLADGGIPCIEHKYVLTHGKSYDLIFHIRLPPQKKPPTAAPDISFQHFTNLKGSFDSLSESYVTINPDKTDLATYEFSAWAMDRSGYWLDASQLTIEDGLSIGSKSVFKVHWISDSTGLITLGGPFSDIEEIGKMPEVEIRSALAKAPDIQHPNAPYQLQDLPIVRRDYTGYVAAVKFNIYVPTYGVGKKHFAHILYTLGQHGKISLTLKSWRNKIIIKGPDERPDCF